MYKTFPSNQFLSFSAFNSIFCCLIAKISPFSNNFCKWSMYHLFSASAVTTGSSPGAPVKIISDHLGTFPGAKRASICSASSSFFSIFLRSSARSVLSQGKCSLCLQQHVFFHSSCNRHLRKRHFFFVLIEPASGITISLKISGIKNVLYDPSCHDHGDKADSRLFVQ